MSLVPDITTTPAWPNVPEGINSKGRVSGDIEKVSPGRSRRRPTCRSFSFASASTQLGATPEARRWGTRAAAGLARPGTSGNRGWCLGRRPQTAERERSTRQRRQRVCTDSFCVFPFLVPALAMAGPWEGVRRPVAFVAGARAFSCVLAERAGHRRLRQRPGRRQTGGGPSRPGARSSPVGAARHGLVLLGFGRERTTERSEVVRALETKFLRFWAGHERDGVPSVLTGTSS